MIDQLWVIQLPKLTVRLTNQSASAHGTFNIKNLPPATWCILPENNNMVSQKSVRVICTQNMHAIFQSKWLPFPQETVERGPADHSHQASRRWYLPEENWWCGNWYQYSWTCFWKVPRPICFFKNEIVWMSPPSHGRLISLFRLLMQLFAQAAKDGKLGTPCEGSYQFRDTGFWDATYYGIVSSKHPDKSWWWHHHSKNGSVLQVSTGI